MNLIFETREDGRIRFTNTSTIQYDQWVKLHTHLNHLGYAFPEPDDVKTYFNRHIWLNKDQSDVVRQVLQYIKPTALFDKTQIETDIQKAKERYGLTTCYPLAGYMLPDGTLLDFSDGQPIRVLDHRQIAEVVHIANSLQPHDFNYINQGLIQFLNYGCIRIINGGLTLSQKPTNKQKLAIQNMAKHYDDFYVDIWNQNGLTVQTMHYIPVLYPSRITTDIDNYFKSLEY